MSSSIQSKHLTLAAFKEELDISLGMSGQITTPKRDRPPQEIE